MSVTILYFAGLREKLGMAAETLVLPPTVQTVTDLRGHLLALGRDALASTPNLRCAINQEMQGFDAPLRDGDEIAFFPPVTGG